MKTGPKVSSAKVHSRCVVDTRPCMPPAPASPTYADCSNICYTPHFHTPRMPLGRLAAIFGACPFFVRSGVVPPPAAERVELRTRNMNYCCLSQSVNQGVREGRLAHGPVTDPEPCLNFLSPICRLCVFSPCRGHLFASTPPAGRTGQGGYARSTNPGQPIQTTTNLQGTIRTMYG